MGTAPIQWLERAEIWLERIITVCSVIFCSTLVVCVFGSVIYRYVLEMPVSGMDELASYSMIWFVFASGALALRHGVHIGVDLIVIRLPAMVRKGVEIFSYLFILSIMIILIIEGVSFVLARTYEVTPSLMLPTWLFYAAVPFGACLMSVQVLIILMKNALVLSKTNKQGKGTDSISNAGSNI
jgi:TRAP-type C4-dicarboxylate transport system permease small subunit